MSRAAVRWGSSSSRAGSSAGSRLRSHRSSLGWDYVVGDVAGTSALNVPVRVASAVAVRAAVGSVRHSVRVSERAVRRGSGGGRNVGHVRYLAFEARHGYRQGRAMAQTCPVGRACAGCGVSRCAPSRVQRVGKAVPAWRHDGLGFQVFVAQAVRAAGLATRGWLLGLAASVWRGTARSAKRLVWGAMGLIRQGLGQYFLI
jgi:hypothetical protein